MTTRSKSSVSPDTDANHSIPSILIQGCSLLSEAQSCGCTADQDLYCICIVDLNVPGAKSSETLSELCSCLQFANDLSPNKSAGLMELPEVAKKSSKRGLADEEAELQTCLWSLRQSCDSRWVCPFNVHPTAEAQTNRRPGINVLY